MTKIRLVILSLFALLTSTLFAQSLTITKPLEVVPNSSVLALYKNQFGHKEKPDLDDTFPYVVIRVKLEGAPREVTAAKKALRLYLGTQTAVEETYTQNPNEILFLIPSRVRFAKLRGGDGYEDQTLIDGMQLQSNMVYTCAVHFVPAPVAAAANTQGPNRQYFKFYVNPTNALVRVQVKGQWQVWPVDPEEGVATRALEHGKYKYEITAENYQPQKGEFTLSRSSTEMKVELKPTFGWLNIQENEALNGAYVFASNTATSAIQQLGQLPFTQVPHLDGGSYQIEITKDKYLPFSSQIEIVPGDTLNFSPQLVANFGTVALSVPDDPQTDIYLDGELLGKGKWTGTLEKGKHSLESRRDYHYSTYTTITVEVKEGTQSFTLEAPLPMYGSLAIEGTPSSCEVYMDGVLMGKTPFIVNQVLAGPHNLRVERRGHIPYIEEIIVEEAAETTIEYALKRGSLPKTDPAAAKPTPASPTPAASVLAQGDSASTLLAADSIATPAPKRRFINTVLLYEAGYDFTMNLGAETLSKGDALKRRIAHGAFFGQAYNGVGWYIQGRSNFDFTTSDRNRVASKGGYVQGIIPYYSGKIKSSSWTAGGGLLFDFTSMGNTKKKSKYNTFGIYLGGGYSVRNIFWETTNGTWIKYGPDSFQGASADGGVIFSVAAVTLSCGVTTIGFKYTELHAGLGVTF